jgi:hypothetical protein
MTYYCSLPEDLKREIWKYLHRLYFSVVLVELTDMVEAHPTINETRWFVPYNFRISPSVVTLGMSLHFDFYLLSVVRWRIEVRKPISEHFNLEYQIKNINNEKKNRVKHEERHDIYFSTLSPID